MGAAAGLLLGALYLGGSFVRAFVAPQGCGGLGREDCLLLREAAREVGRLQGAAAVALLLLAWALLRGRRVLPPRS